MWTMGSKRRKPRVWALAWPEHRHTTAGPKYASPKAGLCSRSLWPDKERSGAVKERGRLDVSERERLVRSWSTKTRDPVHGGTTLRFILNTHLKLHPLSYAQASGMGQHSTTTSQGQRRLQPVPTLSRSGLQLPSGQMEMARLKQLTFACSLPGTSS